MADDISVQDSTDTSVTEDVDTSTNEEAQDTEDLEDSDVSFDESDETEEPEEPEEDEAATESTDESEEESSEDEGSQSPDQESKEEHTTSEVDRERAAKVAFEERAARRRAEKTQSQQEYLEGAEDDKDLALRQLQIDAYNNRVENNSNKLQNGIDKAVASIELFRTGSPEAKEEMANSLDDFERMFVKRDRNGDPMAVTGDVYQYLQNKADSISRLTGIGARQQTKSKANEKSRTLTKPARTPKEAEKDPMLEGFDEEAGKW